MIMMIRLKCDCDYVPQGELSLMRTNPSEHSPKQTDRQNHAQFYSKLFVRYTLRNIYI